MLNLDGMLSVEEIRIIENYTNQRFKDASSLIAPEALSLYEEGFAEDSVIRELCSKTYNLQVFEPTISYVPEDIITAFSGSGLLPVIYAPMRRVITAVYIPDLPIEERFSYLSYSLEIVPTTPSYYFRIYQQYYGLHSALNEMPAKTLFQSIVHEAISLGAIDITILNIGKSTQAYYNVKKHRIDSKKVFPFSLMEDIIKLLTITSPMNLYSYKPKDVDVDLTAEYRGRVVINTTVSGYMITIRLLPNRTFNTALEDLQLSDGTISWLRESFLCEEAGLRLMVGATMSGKNTTILSTLRELAQTNQYKIVSIEMPVEQKLKGIEQISVEKEEEFIENVRSLVRMNPDLVYLTEIRDSIGLTAVQLTNTGKRVFSTLHANGVSDTISRLVDITGLSYDRVVQSLCAVCFQTLNYNKELDCLYPKNRFVRFDKDLKNKLYGKSLGEIIQIIDEYEEGD